MSPDCHPGGIDVTRQLGFLGDKTNRKTGKETENPGRQKDAVLKDQHNGPLIHPIELTDPSWWNTAHYLASEKGTATFFT